MHIKSLFYGSSLTICVWINQSPISTALPKQFTYGIIWKRAHTHTHTRTHCSRNWVLVLVGVEILWAEDGFEFGFKRCHPQQHLLSDLYFCFCSNFWREICSHICVIEKYIFLLIWLKKTYLKKKILLYIFCFTGDADCYYWLLNCFKKNKKYWWHCMIVLCTFRVCCTF